MSTRRALIQAAAPGARYALSKSPETQNGPPLRTPTPASTRPRVMSPQLVEDDDRPHQPGTRSRRMFPTAGPPANSLTRPTASSQRQQRQSDSRSRSPKKPPEYLQAFNPAALEADPISEFSDDEPTIVEAPDFQPRGRQSSRQARSPSKPEAPASSVRESPCMRMRPSRSDSCSRASMCLPERSQRGLPNRSCHRLTYHWNWLSLKHTVIRSSNPNQRFCANDWKRRNWVLWANRAYCPRAHISFSYPSNVSVKWK